MKSLCFRSTLAIILTIPALAQQPATPPQNSPSPGNTPTEQQNNAASATKDNSGISGDQVTKPAGAKGTTLIGCLRGPTSQGRYVLTSMQHRAGVQVLGPDDLRSDSGSKVKLTGAWEPSPQPPSQDKTSPSQEKTKDARRFQVTAVEVLAQHCQVPSEKTPVSKEKQRERAEQQQQTNSNADQASPR
jgi:hypothetical protein